MVGWAASAWATHDDWLVGNSQVAKDIVRAVAVPLKEFLLTTGATDHLDTVVEGLYDHNGLVPIHISCCCGNR